MKLQTSLQIAGVLAALTFGANRACAQAASPVDYAPGLVGQNYSAVEASYIDRDDSALPSVLHHYAFVASRPIDDELKQTDAAFHYDYTRGNANGLIMQTHEVAASLLHYLPLGNAKPFLQGKFGWAWSRGYLHETSAVWEGVVGAELTIAPRVALTPFVRYRSLPRFHDESWHYGAKLLSRFDRDWSGSIGVALDENANPEYSLGVQRRF